MVDLTAILSVCQSITLVDCVMYGLLAKYLVNANED